MTEATNKIPLNTVEILGIRIISTKFVEVLKEITQFVAEKRENSFKSKSLIIFTPNPEFVVIASEDQEFKEILNQANINLPDGIGLILAGKLLGRPLKERISGADVVEKLLEVGNREEWRVGVAGSRRGDMAESEELIKKLQEKYPNLRIVNLDKTGPNYQLLIANYFDIVLACQGMVKQEKWIMENKTKIPGAVFMGVGGSLDFLAGFAKRAPLLVRKLGLEWLWRVLRRPSHLKRAFRATVVFGWLVVKELL